MTMSVSDDLPYDAEQALLALARNLVFARKKRRWRQQDVADRSGITRSTVRKIELGDPNVSMKNYLKVMSLYPGIELLAKVNLTEDQDSLVTSHLEELPLRVRHQRVLDNDF